MDFKTTSAVIFVALSALKSNSQMIWAPEGATWHFNFGAVCFSGYNKVQVEGDSIIDGQTCKKMKPHVYAYACGGAYADFELDYELTYADNDRVYHWTGEDFEVLYDFLLQPNDIYVVGAYDPCIEGDTLLVTEVGTLTINGLNLRYYDVELLNNWFGEVIFGRIVERIGPIESYLFPLPRCLPDYMHSGPFRCYFDGDFETYSSEVVSDCDYLGISERTKSEPILVYPNPSSNQINVTSIELISHIEISDVSGRIVFTQQPNSTQINLDIASLSTGCYFISTEFQKGTRLTSKFVKN